VDFAHITTLIGFVGGVAVLGGFAGVASGRLAAHGARYHALNLAGGLALVIAGLPAGAWPSVLVNGAWALISAHGLTRARESSLRSA
jgi:hypothetical protein